MSIVFGPRILRYQLQTTPATDYIKLLLKFCADNLGLGNRKYQIIIVKVYKYMRGLNRYFVFHFAVQLQAGLRVFSKY